MGKFTINICCLLVVSSCGALSGQQVFLSQHLQYPPASHPFHMGKRRGVAPPARWLPGNPEPMRHKPKPRFPTALLRQRLPQKLNHLSPLGLLRKKHQNQISNRLYPLRLLQKLIPKHHPHLLAQKKHVKPPIRRQAPLGKGNNGKGQIVPLQRKIDWEQKHLVPHPWDSARKIFSAQDLMRMGYRLHRAKPKPRFVDTDKPHIRRPVVGMIQTGNRASDKKRTIKVPFRMSDTQESKLRFPNAEFCSKMDLKPADQYFLLPWYYYYCTQYYDNQDKRMDQSGHFYLPYYTKVLDSIKKYKIEKNQIQLSKDRLTRTHDALSYPGLPPMLRQ